MRSPGLAIVGSRSEDEPLVNCTHDVASMASKAGRTVVSGAAKGADQAATRAALEAGGRATGVLAGELDRTTMNRRLAATEPFAPCDPSRP